MAVNPSNFKGDDLPVENVSWNDIAEFLRLLNARTAGVSYRLPTEAEWEYACRAGTTGPWAGNLDSMAWYQAMALYGTARPDHATHPVGQKQPNAWGLYDMHGNVWEWVQDWYGTYSEDAQTDPTGPQTGTSRVMRGGSALGDSSDTLSAVRGSNAPDFHSLDIGFRLVAVVRTP